jgi:hypothetical protein
MRFLSVLGGLGIAAVVLARTQTAHACGGCFHPPPQQMQTITVVTDHRMAFAVSPKATTLYDQIHYMGDPSAFAWVLPIAGTVDVGLSADVLFGTLDALTQTTLTAPMPTVCPPAPNCNYGGYYHSSGGGCSFGSSASVDDFAASDGGTAGSVDAAFGGAKDSGGVEVTKREVVGPYDTVQLKATDPAALETWLTTNGFAIPNDVKPIVAAYQSEGFGFLAMKLLPGQNVLSMRPVRVTTMGAGLGLPLRMVSAGTGSTVGITLWVVAEGRYEPQNFMTFRIADSDLVWDWKTKSSNYTTLRAQMTADNKGAAWELESSMDISRFAIENYILSGGRGFGMAPAGDDYLPVIDPMTMKVLKTPDQARQDDLDALLSGMQQQGRVTRFRTDMAHEALVKDLQLTASNDQSPISNNHTITKSVNEPPCPTYPPCPEPYVYQQARGGSSCSTTSSIDESASSVALGIATAFFTTSIVRRRRKRR